MLPWYDNMISMVIVNMKNIFFLKVRNAKHMSIVTMYMSLNIMEF